MTFLDEAPENIICDENELVLHPSATELIKAMDNEMYRIAIYKAFYNHTSLCDYMVVCRNLHGDLYTYQDDCIEREHLNFTEAEELFRLWSYMYADSINSWIYRKGEY